MQINVMKLDPNAKLPTRGSEYAAGWDLYALNSEIIEPGECKLIHTGLALEIPDGYFGAIYARSGLATKQGLRPANCVGVIDSDYRGEVCVALRNDNPAGEFRNYPVGHIDGTTGVCREEFVSNHSACKYISAGDRVAQLIIQKFDNVEFVESAELSTTDRGEGGFGSTGTK